MISSSSLILAYVLSPRQGRHPYLIWTAVMVGLSNYGSFAFFCAWGRHRLDTNRMRRRRLRGEFGDGDVNGEEVERAMGDFQFRQAVRAAVAGVGFLMNIVGIWGDGY